MYRVSEFNENKHEQEIQKYKEKLNLKTELKECKEYN
jgi:hypothetical protein